MERRNEAHLEHEVTHTEAGCFGAESGPYRLEYGFYVTQPRDRGLEHNCDQKTGYRVSKYWP